MNSIFERTEKKFNTALSTSKNLDLKSISKNLNNDKVIEKFSEKIDHFYETLIPYTKLIYLSKNLQEEIKLYDDINSREQFFILNNLVEIKNKLVKLKSDFIYEINFYQYKIIEENFDKAYWINVIMEKWEFILVNKIINQRLKLLEQLRSKNKKPFFSKIELIKHKLKILNTFPDFFNAFWNEENKKNKINIKYIRKYASFLAKNPIIKRIAYQLGKLLNKSEKLKQKTKFLTGQDIKTKKIILSKFGSDFKFDKVIESDNLAMLLASEMLYLSEKEYEIIFYKKFAEKKLLTYNFMGEKNIEKNSKLKLKDEIRIPKNMGDVIICIDTSNSMSGPSEIISKILLVSLLENILNFHNRKCIIVNFSSELSSVALFDAVDNLKLLDHFLSESYCGSTYIDLVLERAINYMLKKYNEESLYDVLIISDFIVPNMSNSLIKAIEKMKKNFNSFFAIQIGNEGNNEFTKFFNNCWLYNPDEPFTAERFLNSIIEYNTIIERE